MFTKSRQYILLLGIFYSSILSSAPSVYAENWALLVGIDDYKIISPDLRFCQSDAIRMKEAIIKYAGFKEENVKTVLGQEASKKRIKKAIQEWLINNVKPGDKAFLGIFQHGQIWG